MGLHKKSKQSAKGAEYESQGQVPSKARHVAPGYDMHEQIRPERPKYERVLRAFSAGPDLFVSYQGRRAPLRFTLAPGFHIPRLWRSVSGFCAKPRLIESKRQRRRVFALNRPTMGWNTRDFRIELERVR
jgi:hypothetical protein